jgi:hypothetical protein
MMLMEVCVTLVIRFFNSFSEIDGQVIALGKSEIPDSNAVYFFNYSAVAELNLVPNIIHFR